MRVPRQGYSGLSPMGMAIAVKAGRGVVASECASVKRAKQTHMSRTNQRLRSVLTLAVLAAVIPAAYAQDATPASPAAATTADPAAAGQDKTAAQPASGPQAGKTPVCFKMTMHCVDGTAAKKKGDPATKDSAPAKPMNLTAPDISTVVSPDELKEPLPSADQDAQVQDSETVSIKGDGGVPPDVPGGFGALWWALNHPSQAWRILAPAE
jgi:hypothetical protein